MLVTHYIRLDFLEQVVLYEIHRLACFANEYENDFIKAMVGRSAKVAENDRVRKSGSWMAAGPGQGTGYAL